MVFLNSFLWSMELSAEPTEPWGDDDGPAVFPGSFWHSPKSRRKLVGWGCSAYVTGSGAATSSGVCKSASKEHPPEGLRRHRAPLFHKTVPDVSPRYSCTSLPNYTTSWFHHFLEVSNLSGDRDLLLEREAREERQLCSSQLLGSGC